LLSSKHNTQILFFELHGSSTHFTQATFSVSRKKQDILCVVSPSLPNQHRVNHPDHGMCDSSISLRLFNKRPIIQSNPLTCH